MDLSHKLCSETFSVKVLSEPEFQKEKMVKMVFLIIQKDNCSL